jgi:hypothetical protein
MSWRVALGVVVGLALPVPLLWALASTLHPSSRQPPQNAQVSPMLTFEERSRLQSYHRDCSRREDCEPPLACLGNPTVKKHYCTDSECTLDTHCAEGFSCQWLPTAGAGPWVRYCLPHGIRAEGEPCLSIPPDQETACQAGLLCGNGWCGRPCQLDNPSSCPEGFFCSATLSVPSCRPTCEGRGCPEGQRCIRDSREGASTCAVVYGQDCQHSPCAQGQKCEAIFSTKTRVSAWMRCKPECGKETLSCPRGLVCDRTSCLKPCEPDGPDVCEPGFRCLRHNDRQQWLCRPDM